MLGAAVENLKAIERVVDPNKYKRYAIMCGIAFAVAALVSYIMFPEVLSFIIKNQLQLKPNRIVRKLYETIPFPLVFKIYIFNITNKDAVMNGEKPHLQQIGPYVFHEFKKKVDTEDDKDADTLEFTLINKWIFKPKLSGGLTGDEVVTVFHPVLVSIGLGVNVDRKPMLPMASTAIKEIFHDPVHPFWTGRAMDLLFDGIPLDCSSTNFNAKAICSVFETGEVQAITQVDANTFKFSFFGAYNNTDNGRFKVMRGSSGNYSDLNRVVEVDGVEELETYGEDYCNQFRGTDGLLFPPFMNKEADVWAYERSICLSLPIRPVKSSRFRGTPTYLYTADFGDVASDENLLCYCRTEDHCPMKGTFDLFNCIGVPIIVSLPHFYLADPKLLDDIGSGISPNKKEHMIFVHFETLTGTPLRAAKRAQVNFEVVPIPEIESMQNLREMVFPVFWIEEGLVMNKKFTFLFYLLYGAQLFNVMLKVISIPLGVAALSFLLAYIYRENDKRENANTNNVRQIKQFIDEKMVVDKKMVVDEKKKMSG